MSETQVDPMDAVRAAAPPDGAPQRSSIRRSTLRRVGSRWASAQASIHSRHPVAAPVGP